MLTTRSILATWLTAAITLTATSIDDRGKFFLLECVSKEIQP